MRFQDIPTTDADRLAAIVLLIPPLTDTPDDNSLVAYSIQRIAEGEETPDAAIGALGPAWADVLAAYCAATGHRRCSHAKTEAVTRAGVHVFDHCPDCDENFELVAAVPSGAEEANEGE